MRQNSYLLIVIFFLLPISLLAQISEDAKVKAEHIHTFTQHIEWPDEKKLNTFQIAIFNDAKEIFPALEELQFTIDIKNKPIELLTYNTPTDITDPQVLYVNHSRLGELSKIFEQIKSRPILVITDHNGVLSSTMINLKKEDGKEVFEINSKKIEKYGLKVSPKLLFLGGNDVDLKQLYLESEKSLEEEKRKVVEQKRLLEEQAKEMLYQKQQIGLQKISIGEQTERLNKQRDSLSKQEDQIDEQRYELEKLIRAIRAKESVLIEKSQLLFHQELNITRQRKQVEAYNGTLDLQKSEIKKHRDLIEEQLDVLNQKEQEIGRQRTILYLGAGGLLLFIVLMIVIWISYRSKKKANAMLEEKNKAIELINIEISRQRDETEKQKRLVESAHEQITSSIRYATTIQMAMLPRPYEFEEFDHLILYKPKDIVSGDFYWMRTFDYNNTTYHMVAVVDCTGHGVPGAFMSMIANRLLNEIVTVKQIYEPALVLDYLDRYVQGSLRQETGENTDGMDVCLVRISEKKNGFRNVIFAGAKRPLFYYNAQQDIMLRKKGSRRGIGGPKGKTKLDPFETEQLTLRTGDAVYLCSDGYIDQNNTARKRYGSTRFTELLSRIAKENMTTQLQMLEETMADYQDEASQRDDISLVGLRM